MFKMRSESDSAKGMLMLFAFISVNALTLTESMASAVSATRSEAKSTALESTLQHIRDFINSSMLEWKVPGLAMAIVKGDRVIFAQGFGLRNVQADLPVTADTIFAIGSQSKAFTSLAIGMLVEEGKLDWDEPVRTYLPAFEVKDPCATERATLRDLALMRWGLIGLPAAFDGVIDRSDVIKRLQFLRPDADFRTVYHYSDLAFVVAGYLVGQVTGGTWEEFTQQRIFNPLGMKNSNFSVDDSPKSDNYALPYHLGEDGVVRKVPFRNLDVAGPAGSINSTVNDMANWLMVHVNKGRSKNGEQLISESSLEEILKPQIVLLEQITALPTRYKERSFMSYGLGWFIETYRGFKRVHHGGGIDGFKAKISMIPEQNLAVIVLTNLSGVTPLPEIAALYATDLLLGLEPLDWSSRVRKHHDQQKAKQAVASWPRMLQCYSESVDRWPGF